MERPRNLERLTYRRILYQRVCSPTRKESHGWVLENRGKSYPPFYQCYFSNIRIFIYQIDKILGYNHQRLQQYLMDLYISTVVTIIKGFTYACTLKWNFGADPLAGSGVWIILPCRSPKIPCFFLGAKWVGPWKTLPGYYHCTIPW